MDLTFENEGEEITLHPTHTCFDDALDYLEALVKKDNSIAFTDQYLLAHGILDAGDHHYSHAWIETKDTVVDGRIYKGQHIMAEYDKKGFYKTMKVIERTLYTVKELHLENMKHGTYGPWIDRYKKLCRNYKGK